MTKWIYERLLLEWNELIHSHSTLATFGPARDKLITESGWSKEEFYREIDRRALEMYT